MRRARDALKGGVILNRLAKLFVKTILISTILTLLISGAVLAEDSAGPMGPAPNSGDCVPDGNGFDPPPPFGFNGEIEPDSQGPAPNSGDGDPDGSGF